MLFHKDQLKLYAITDSTGLDRQTFLKRIEAALQGGITMLQLREKHLSKEELKEEALQVKALCENYQVPLIINDHVDVALEIGADGVHVGAGDIPVALIRKQVPEHFIIGATCKTVSQARAAELAGADYMGVGAVFPSSTKQNALRITKEQLQEIAAAVRIPTVAIGGIDLNHIAELQGTSIAGVAVVSAIFGVPDIQTAASTLKTRINQLLFSNTAKDMPKHMAHGASEHTSKQVKTVLSIAGSDCSGGAGIQADIKTMTMHGVYAMSAITALTAQNTTGVRSIQEATPEFLAEQLDAVFEDIYPDAVKIGMVSSPELIHTIADRLRFYHAHNVVVDPVMVATSGSSLMKNDAVQALIDELLPLAALVTPNIPEAQVLSGLSITNKEDMEAAAKKIGEAYHCAVLLKGGHSIHDADDLLYENGTCRWFEGKRIDNPNTHGTGCTLSSAIASNLAKGYALETSVQNAKDYISNALAAQLDLGKGSGPMLHHFALLS